MATSPAPDAAAPPGMCPGIAVLGGGGGGGDGDGSGDGGKDGADGNGGNGSGDGNNGGEGCGDPVCPITGRVFLDVYDFGFAGPLLLRWIRSYSSRSSNRSGELGFGWSHAFGHRLVERRGEVVVLDGAAKEQSFRPVPPLGGWVDNALGWSLHRAEDGYRLRVEDGTEYLFGEPIGGVRHLVAVVDTHNNRTQLTRGDRGELKGIVDSAGRPYHVATDRFGRICRVDIATEATHASTMMVALYEYDEAGNLARFVDAEGFEFRYRYDGHLLVEHETPGGLFYHYRYDGHDQDAYCVETWGDRHGSPDPALDVQPPPAPATGRDTRPYKGINHVRFEYDKEGHYSEVSDAIGGVTRYYGDANGRVLKRVDPGGGVTERRYDPESGALVAESTPSGAVRTVRREGRFSRGWEDSSGSGSDVIRDAAGGEVSFNPETGFYLRTTTDERGALTFVQHGDGTIETYTSDERGLVTRSTNRLGATTRFEHDAMGNCVLADHQDLGASRTEYDYLGRRVAHVDVFGRRTEWTYDRRGDVVTRRNPDGSTIHVQRDWFRRPTQVEDRGRIYRFTYGGIGWLCRAEYPGGQVFEYRYDAEGHLVAVTNPRGQVHRRSYDRAGRPVTCETFEGLEHKVWYDVAGRAVRLASPAGEELREYDEQGRLVGAELADGEVVKVERDRRKRTVCFTNGHVRSEQEYDPMGQIVRDRQGRHETRVTWRGGALAAMVSDVGVPVVLDRRLNGHVRELRAGNTSVGLNAFTDGPAVVSRWSDRLALVRRYGDSGELRSFTLVRLHPGSPQAPEEIAAVAPADALQHVAFSYDPRALLESEQSTSGRTVSYDLDAAGQVRERRLFQGGALVTVERLAHDAAGTPLVEGAQFDALSRPVSFAGERFSYDDAGRLCRRETDRGAFRYEYGPLGDLVRVVAPDHEVRFTYDGKSRRMRKCVYRQHELVKDIHYVWSNNVVLHEYDALSGSSRTYLREDARWEPFGHVDVIAGEERATFYLPHPSGGVFSAVDDAGRTVWDAALTTYGHAEPAIRAVDVTARYPNQFYDADVELVYNYFRWYDPRLGLYVSPDPLLLEGSTNPRDYAANPLAEMDPTGLFTPRPNQTPTQQDGQGGGGGQFPRTPSAANGQPRPSTLPTQNDLTNPNGTYLTTPGAYATNGTHNSVGQWVPGYANVPPGFSPTAQRGWPRSLQQQVDNAGYTHGCHSCGSTDPGPSGHFTPDHQPSVSQQKAAAAAGSPIPASSVRYYPHCSRCSGNQANQQNALSRNPAANAAQGQATAANNANPDFAHPNNATPPTQAQMDATSNHMFGPGYDARGPVPPAQNAGDNRYLGGASYNHWR